MGPVLVSRGQHADEWRLSALAASPEVALPPPLVVNGGEVPPVELNARCGRRLWRFEFGLALGESASTAEYRFGDRRLHVNLPPRDGSLRLAYTSCNGSPIEPAWPSPAVRNAAWRQLAREHVGNPFHLLLQGGDQLYADDVWASVPALVAWRRLPRRQRLAAPLDSTAVESIRDHYFMSYLRQWSQPELEPVLASIPSLMMWDDHDIFDGWGSLRPELQECPAYRAVWRAAREAFRLFQLALCPDESPAADEKQHPLGWVYRFGSVGIIAPDLRSERRRDRVMGEEGWRRLTAALAQCDGCRHLIFMASVPLLHVNLGPLEQLVQLVPGQQSHQDDLRDQWQSPAHRAEWQRLLLTLGDFSGSTRAKVTIVSGEIHLGALAEARLSGTTLHQLIASGVVHPPPPAIWSAALELLARRAWQPFPGVRVAMLPLPSLGRRYLRARNWLTLELRPEGRVDATWHVVDTSTAYRVILPPACPNSG